jgi:hypothetical protein
MYCAGDLSDYGLAASSDQWRSEVGMPYTSPRLIRFTRG